MESQGDMTNLQSLPYDLLLNVAQHLEFTDIHALQSCCRCLYDFVATRPVYRSLAHSLLRRSRALPLTGFQHISDLTTDQLIRAVTRAARIENAWLRKTPRRANLSPYLGSSTHNREVLSGEHESWYRVVSSPPHEEIDWLSPITSSYTLCATKSGKVVCWDVQHDVALAEWTPKERWELWKCRVEFEDRTVFFTMAKVLEGLAEQRIMEFILMKLQFSSVSGEPTSSHAPIFSQVTTFKTKGVVMNVFLLDPPTRLLSALIWVPDSNTIGLYAILDWDESEYVFIDTGIECSFSSNFSCIFYEHHIVVHSEEAEAAFQHFYPLSLLQQHVRPSSPSSAFVPPMTGRLDPAYILSTPFLFPPSSCDADALEELFEEGSEMDVTTPTMPVTQVQGAAAGSAVQIQIHTDTADASPAVVPVTNGHQRPDTPDDTDDVDDNSVPVTTNPYPFPLWFPESAHFVRQWWPTLPDVRRLSCAVILLTHHDRNTHQNSYVLAQHYFKVPFGRRTVQESRGDGTEIREEDGEGNEKEDSLSDVEDDLMRMWYVSEPFDIVSVPDIQDILDLDEGELAGDRRRPLLAVDFNHAVWIEYVPDDGTLWETDQIDKKRLRFVSFPPVSFPSSDGGSKGKEKMKEYEGSGHVKTLEIPDELDLDRVDTINVDQSQGSVILSVREGKIFILYYE